ncbi:MAG: hypothetical protein ACFHVJ_08350 [Aestuariibacter sp.]
MKTGVFAQFFGEFKDLGQYVKLTHLFADILFFMVFASISGIRGWKYIDGLHFYLFTDKRNVQKWGSVLDTNALVEKRKDSELFQRYLIGQMQTVAELFEGQIIASDSEYVLALQGIQKELHDAVRSELDGAINQELM